jgi:hypothetical protein
MTDQHELSGLYALDALEADERDAYELHLAGCAACQREVASFRETIAVVASVVRDDDIELGAAASGAELSAGAFGEAPPPALRSRVLQDINAAETDTAPLAPVVAMTSASRRRAAGGRASTGTRRWWPAAAAAVIVVAVLGGLLAARDGSQSESALLAELESKGARSVAMSDSGQARLVLSTDGRRAVIVASGVAPLDDAHVYQAWTIDTDASVTPAPLFRPDSSGNVLVALRSLPDDLDMVAVTIEPRAGSKLPTTPVLMSAKVA